MPISSREPLLKKFGNHWSKLSCASVRNDRTEILYALLSCVITETTPPPNTHTQRLIKCTVPQRTEYYLDEMRGTFGMQAVLWTVPPTLLTP